METACKMAQQQAQIRGSFAKDEDDKDGKIPLVILSVAKEHKRKPSYEQANDWVR
jgi:hypothetical protein